jgi:hypothetical protein
MKMNHEALLVLGALVMALFLQACPISQSGPPKEVAMQSPPSPGGDQKPAPAPAHAPELVGATSTPLTLSTSPTEVTVSLRPPTGPARSESAKLQRKVFLTVENVTSKQDAPNFLVYLNLPSGEDPEPKEFFLVGTLTTFGLVESSVETGNHPSNGLSDSFDVTSLFLKLAKRKDWDPAKLRVTFAPRDWNRPLQVKVGRVGFFVQ